MYITEEIIDHIVEQTNLYAQQFIAEQHDLRTHSLIHQWKPTDRAEVITLLSILILMGIVYKPRLALYWTTDSLISMPIFNQIMFRDRFLILVRFLHFADNRNNNMVDQE